MAAKRPSLAVEKRTVLGKKVKKLRREGILPANVYGKDLASQAVQVKLSDFEPLYKEVGATGLIDVELDGQKRPVLIHEVHRDYRNNVFLHADFYQVNLKEKIKTMVPVELVGEPKAVSDQTGLLMQTLSEIEVEALPEALPEKFEVNVEHLATIDEQVTVGDITAPKDVEILTEKEQVVAKIGELISEEAKALAAEEAAAAEAAKAETGAEGETPAEGEAPEKPAEGEAKEEPKSEEKPQG